MPAGCCATPPSCAPPSAAVAGVVTGRLDIVALPTLAVDPLARLIGAFRAAHPGVTVQVTEPEDAASVERQVLAGRAELGFADLTTGGRDLVRVELFRQEVVAVSPPGTVDRRADADPGGAGQAARCWPRRRAPPPAACSIR